MVFGVFDGLHPGHRAFLKQAKKYGRQLVVVVARDSVVLKLKRKLPRYNEKMRLRAIRKVQGVSRAALGDKKQGSYGVIKRYKPDVICVGYDQRELERDLRRKMQHGLMPRIPIFRLKSYRPSKFQSSIMSGGDA